MFPSTLKPKAGFFIFLQFEERYREASFSDGLVWTVCLTVEIRLAFPNFSAVVWMGPKAFSLHIRRYIYNDVNFSKLFYGYV